MNKSIITALIILTINFCCLSPLAAQPGQKLMGNATAEKDRPEIGAVVYAAVLIMRRQPLPNRTVDFSPASRQSLTKEPFRYKGFGKPIYSVTHYLQKRNNAGEDIFNLGTIFYFTDMALRRCAIYCNFKYVTDSGEIQVKEAALKRLAIDHPRTLMVVIPAPAVPRNLLQVKKNHLDLLQWMMRNALPSDRVPSPPVKRPYYIFATTLDRLNPEDHLQLCVSDQRQGISGEKGGCMDENYGGWHVAILKGDFTLKAQPSFYFKAVYTPGNGGQSVLIGTYSSEMPTRARNQSPPSTSLTPPPSRTTGSSPPPAPIRPGGSPQTPPSGSGWHRAF